MTMGEIYDSLEEMSKLKARLELEKNRMDFNYISPEKREWLAQMEAQLQSLRDEEA